MPTLENDRPTGICRPGSQDFDRVIDAFNERLFNIPYPTEASALFAPIGYTIESGGKRLRPTLLLRMAMACGADAMDAIDSAIGIELFHNFTLLHDDIMDNADVRRGRPSVHRRWNDNVAILSGDAMLTIASGYMNSMPGDTGRCIFELFTKTALEIYQGQQLDMEFEDRDDVSVDEYIRMIRLKTSVLLGCACRIGAMLGKASDYACKAAYDFGDNLGLAFQLRDDLLDTFGDPVLFGKQIGGDILNKKKTWLLISALEQGNREDICSALDAKTDDTKKIESVKSIYRSLDLDVKCQQLVDAYAQRAISALDRMALGNVHSDYFRSLATDLSQRQA